MLSVVSRGWWSSTTHTTTVNDCYCLVASLSQCCTIWICHDWKSHVWFLELLQVILGFLWRHQVSGGSCKSHRWYWQSYVWCTFSSVSHVDILELPLVRVCHITTWQGLCIFLFQESARAAGLRIRPVINLWPSLIFWGLQDQTDDEPSDSL